MATNPDPNVGQQSSAPSKSVLTSKTFWAAVLGLVVMFFPHLLDKLGVGDPSLLADKIVGAISFAGVLYGRFKAGGVHFFLS